MKGYLSIHNFKTGRYSISTEIKVQEYTQPITQKWLNGDILDMRGNEPAVISRNAKAHKSLVGIIDFVNHIRVGMTPKGVPLYNFHPYDTAYPVMQVASKHTSTENKIALAAFEHWDNKVPRAGIQHIFGCVGDTEAEIAALQMGIVVPRTITEEQIPEANTRIHDGSEWDIVFNIDPDGCKDVDDVMGWRKTPTKLEFFIGIVDIDSWIPEGSTLDIDAMKAGQTLYIDGVAVEPMFPEEISERRASLRADGVKRPVLALVYTFPNNAEIQVQEPSWALLNVHVHEAYTYESVLQNPVIVSQLPEILAKITMNPATNDPHIWVEQAMIMYNTMVAKVLKEQRVGILRKHEGITRTTYAELADKTGIKELAFLGSASGQYTLSTNPDTAHAGLGLLTYCHASSPLRRYSDVVNHRWLKYAVFGYAMPQAYVNPAHLNHRSTLIKHFEHTAWFLRNIRQNAITMAKGYIISYNNEKDEAKVYVPAWKRTILAGKVTHTTYAPGDKVNVRAFTNLRATTLHKRVVCAMEPTQA